MSTNDVTAIVTPIVVAIVLAGWIGAVFHANAHPANKRPSRPPRTEVAGGAFEANAGGRQLMPIWGERPSAIPGPRTAASTENYQPGDLRPEGASEPAPQSGAPAQSAPAGIGLPPS